MAWTVEPEETTVHGCKVKTAGEIQISTDKLGKKKSKQKLVTRGRTTTVKGLPRGRQGEKGTSDTVLTSKRGRKGAKRIAERRRREKEE